MRGRDLSLDALQAIAGPAFAVMNLIRNRGVEDAHGPLVYNCLMAKIEIYTRSVCPYCNMAKGLLQSKGQEWVEHNIDSDPAKADEMIERADGRMTVPEIFIDDKLIGGYDDLVALERDGALDGLL